MLAHIPWKRGLVQMQEGRDMSPPGNGREMGMWLLLCLGGRESSPRISSQNEDGICAGTAQLQPLAGVIPTTAVSQELCCRTEEFCLFWGIKTNTLKFLLLQKPNMRNPKES